MNNSNNKGNNDSKKIMTLIVLIATVIITTTGATYAYFAISATSTGEVTGTAASGNIAFQVQPTLVAPAPGGDYATTPMVPQFAYNNSKNTLQLAVTGGTPVGTTKVPCVDNNGNVVCKVYTFTIKNNATAGVVVSGTIKFGWTGSTNTYANLKWAPMSSATSTAAITGTADTDIHAIPNTTEDIVFTDAAATPNTSWPLAVGASKQFWFVVWIQETNTDQTNTDKGTWTATLTFKEANGKGITSTIVG